MSFGTFLLRVLVLVSVILFVPLVIYLRQCLRFYRIQPYLLYQPRYDLTIRAREKTVPHRDIFYLTRDGRKIHAWFVPAPAEEEKETPEGPVVLFCHGNAGNLTHRIDSFKIFRELGLNTFIFDYRGYGRSRGWPSEKGMYLDAEGAWLFLLQQMKVKPEDIIIFGRSLGGGVASYLAEKYHARACIIESSFTSVPDMAAFRFRWLPARWLTRFHYNTLQRLPQIHCPILIIHSPEDEVIPFAHGKKLYETANPPKHFLEIRGNHLLGFADSRSMYMAGLKDFLAGL